MFQDDDMPGGAAPGGTEERAFVIRIGKLFILGVLFSFKNLTNGMLSGIFKS